MAGIADQNWVVWNQGKNPLVNFNFMLRVELMFDLPCKSVRAFTRELEYDYIQEGGLNDYVHMRRKPITRPFTLEIERYVGVDYLDPLPLGADLVLPVLLFVSRNHDQFVPGVVARTYVFTGCTVMKKTYGDLVADQSGLLVETTTLGYREMLCVDIPWSEVGDNIPKDIKTAPTNAVSADKTPAELKALANDLYSQALSAKTRADTEFAEADATALINELDETLTKLRAAVGPGGSLTQQLDTAKAGISGEGGKTKKALADEAMDDARLAEQDSKEKENAWREKDAVWRKAKDALDDIRTQIDGPTKKLADLEEQLRQARETEAELEAGLPADLRDVEKARSAQQEAQTDYDAAEAALAEAKAALEKAMEDARAETDVKAARERAENIAAELAAKQADVDAASQSLAEAQKAYQAALRAWKEEQGEELERAEAKRKSCEDAVRAREKAARQLEKDTKAQEQAVADLKKAQEQAEDSLEKAKQDLADIQTEEQTADSGEGDSEADGELEQRRQDAENALEAAQKDYDKVQDELEEAQKQFAETREKAQKQAEALKQAEKALEDAQAEEKTEADKLEKGPVDNDEIEELLQNEEIAEQALTEARKNLDAAQMADQEAQEQLQTTQKEKEKSVTAGEEGRAVEKASELRNEAKAALDTAAVHVKKCEDLAALNEQIKELEEASKAANAEVQAIEEGQLKEAEERENSTKADADEAKKAYDTAAGKWKDASEKAVNARNTAELADQALNKAQSAHSLGSKQINSLQNSLTNMKLRKDTGTQAQTDCSDQHDKCKEANIALQAMSDDNLPEVNAGYEQVKKLSKQTCYHEKQVREVCQHMEAARKLLSEVVEIPATEA